MDYINLLYQIVAFVFSEIVIFFMILDILFLRSNLTNTTVEMIVFYIKYYYE